MQGEEVTSPIQSSYPKPCRDKMFATSIPYHIRLTKLTNPKRKNRKKVFLCTL